MEQGERGDSPLGRVQDILAIHRTTLRCTNNMLWRSAGCSMKRSSYNKNLDQIIDEILKAHPNI